MLEASHRLGGRGLTEYLQNGVAVDLGCHWLHCASRNPYTQWADRWGFEYEQHTGFEQTSKYQHGMYRSAPGQGRWQDEPALAEYARFMDCLLYTSPSPRDATLSRMPSSA